MGSCVTLTTSLRFGLEGFGKQPLFKLSLCFVLCVLFFYFCSETFCQPFQVSINLGFRNIFFCVSIILFFCFLCISLYKTESTKMQHFFLSRLLTRLLSLIFILCFVQRFVHVCIKIDLKTSRKTYSPLCSTNRHHIVCFCLISV